MWELDHKESWAPKNWCFWTVVLEKTLASPLDSKEIQSVHPKGDQSWVFFGRTDVEAETPILWPPDAKDQLIWKDPDTRKDCGQEEKGTTEDEMVIWHYQLNGHGFGGTPGVGDGQGRLACYGSWGRKELDTTEWLNWTDCSSLCCKPLLLFAYLFNFFKILKSLLKGIATYVQSIILNYKSFSLPYYTYWSLRTTARVVAESLLSHLLYRSINILHPSLTLSQSSLCSELLWMSIYEYSWGLTFGIELVASRTKQVNLYLSCQVRALNYEQFHILWDFNILRYSISWLHSLKS